MNYVFLGKKVENKSDYIEKFETGGKKKSISIGVYGQN
jgi:hypothetical protein